jgi:hypothetical protein
LVSLGEEGTSEIVVPGADYAVVRVTEGPFYADDRVRSHTVDVNLHEAGNGNHSTATLIFPGGEEGMELVRQFLGTLRYEG